MDDYVIGIDIGTGSARVGLFDLKGELKATEKRDITTWHDGPVMVEQSSENIWAAICACVRGVVSKAGIAAEQVKGIGTDATCSLVLVDASGGPIGVGLSDDANRNIIVWMDHRAASQAARINALGHDVLRYVGNRISPEMETPKLLWLKENKPEAFATAAHFFDLSDYITWRATGSLDRSICTTTCKWTYLGHERRWDESYFHKVGLSELADEGFKRIGTQIVDAGTALGTGLTATAAVEWGLNAGIPVAAGLIDAHAGGVGTVGAAGTDSATSRLAYVFGTSACTMTSTIEPAFIPGVWGPYFSAMVPGLWLNEAGQSAAGAAIDHLVMLHPAAVQAAQLAKDEKLGLTTWLAGQALSRAATASDVAYLARGLHVVPEFLGNRAPLADPDAKGLIAGLDMDQSIDNLISLYVAGVCGLGYGLRQIIETQAAHGVVISSIVVSGGAGQNAMVRQILADTTGIMVETPKTDEPVLLGAAMLGAVAGGIYSSLTEAMASMSAMGKIFDPAQGELKEWHKRRYDGFQLLQETGRKLRHANI